MNYKDFCIENGFKTINIDPSNNVYCDDCGEDYTDSEEKDKKSKLDGLFDSILKD
jgi:hypothetical protein